MRRITNVQLPAPMGNLQTIKNPWCLEVDDENLIKDLYLMNEDVPISAENWNGDWISPMGLDLQINGGLGISFDELSKDNLPKLLLLLDQLWADGIEAICPTIITSSIKNLHNSLNIFRKARKQTKKDRCILLGAHLEGPFISINRKGAHPEQYICPPSLCALEERIKGYESEISMITLAPELSGAESVIKRLKELHIITCLGHSDGNAEDAKSAFQIGISMLTHTFNAMPGLNHRAPGPIGEALKHKSITLGLIADGIHVNPTMAVLLQRMAPEQVVLISDALAPYALNKERYKWSSRELLIKNGTCWLKDGTLAGSSMSLLESCKRLAKWSCCPSSAIWSGTIAPRTVFGKSKYAEKHVIGKSLKKLLRWKWNIDAKQLSWHHAS